MLTAGHDPSHSPATVAAPTRQPPARPSSLRTAPAPQASAPQPPAPHAAAHQAAPARRTDTVLVTVSAQLARWSVPALRITLGLVFLGFGLLKFFPGASPAEQIVKQTVSALTLGLVHDTAAVILTAVVEAFVGLTLLTGRWLKAGLVVLAVVLVGIMSPIVLFPDELFGGGMTLMGQYVLKDVVFAAGAAVVAAATLGARLTREA
ncbi:DoxX family membrane protein [Oerskovia turbata]